MKRQIHAIIGLVILTMCSFTACEEIQNSTTLRLRFSVSGVDRSSAREVISPEGESLSITGYTVSGNGPNDNTFSVSTNSTQVDISGLVIGTWEISVTGLNQQGTAIAQGSTTHQLTTQDNTVEVTLDEFIGTGYVDVGFSWNDENFPGIGFDLRLKPQGGVEQEITQGKSVDPTNHTARYQTTLPTGSYDLSFTLSSDGIRIAGGVVALRILDGKTSTDEILLVVDKQTPEATGLLIKSLVAEPLEGTIEGLASEVLPNEQLTASFNRSTGGGTEDITVDWYLDGSHLGTSPSINFSTYTGAHRLDAIARTQYLGSTGSATWPFRASVGDNDGIPVIVSDIADGATDPFGAPYKLSGITDTVFLRDGRLLIASSEGLQLCEIHQDRLVIVSNYATSGGGMTPSVDPYPTQGVTDLLADTVDDLVFTSAKELGIIVMYRYTSASASLQKIACMDPSTAPWGAPILNAVIDCGANRLYVADPASKKITHHSYGDGTFANTFTTGLSFSPNPTHLSISPGGNRISVACAADKSVQTYQVVPAIDGASITVESSTSLGTLLPADPFETYMLNEVMLVSTSDGLYRYSKPASGFSWSLGENMSPDGSPVEDLACAGDYSRYWRLHGGSQPKVRTGTMINGVPGIEVEGYLDTGSHVATDISHSPTGNFLAISGNNRLMLLRLTDD